MRTTTTKWNKILDFIFSAPSHISILRTLYAFQNGLSGRECARKSNINHQSCNVALDKLVEIGILYRKGYGRSVLYFVNLQNLIIIKALIPLFQAEADIIKQLKKDLEKFYLGATLSVIIFGSQSKGLAKIGSDLDICFIVQNDNSKKVLNQMFVHSSPWFKNKYGFSINPIYFTKKEIIVLYNSKNMLIDNIIRDGEIIYGLEIKEIIDDKKVKQEIRRSSKK